MVIPSLLLLLLLLLLDVVVVEKVEVEAENGMVDMPGSPPPIPLRRGV